MKSAYQEAFTLQNIESSFSRAGLCPFEPSRFLSTPRPRDLYDARMIVPSEAIMMMFAKQCETYRSRIIGAYVEVQRSEFLDTKRVQVLTIEAAFAAVRAEVELQAERRVKQSHREEKSRAPVPIGEASKSGGDER